MALMRDGPYFETTQLLFLRCQIYKNTRPERDRDVCVCVRARACMCVNACARVCAGVCK